jgi:hypothetical protein
MEFNPVSDTLVICAGSSVKTALTVWDGCDVRGETKNGLFREKEIASPAMTRNGSARSSKGAPYLILLNMPFSPSRFQAILLRYLPEQSYLFL